MDNTKYEYFVCRAFACDFGEDPAGLARADHFNTITLKSGVKAATAYAMEIFTRKAINTSHEKNSPVSDEEEERLYAFTEKALSVKNHQELYTLIDEYIKTVELKYLR